MPGELAKYSRANGVAVVGRRRQDDTYLLTVS